MHVCICTLNTNSHLQAMEYLLPSSGCRGVFMSIDPHQHTLTDYQLQVEHSLDLEQRQQVIFIDASVSSPAPFEFSPVLPARDDSYTSHAMSPAALLAVYEQVCERALPTAHILSIRGYEFELGTPISDRAQNNLDQAVRFLQELLKK